MNTARLLPVLGALVLLGADGQRARAQGQEEPDRVLVTKFLYDPPATQGVVVFKYPEFSKLSINQNYVKRLVGLPGEAVVIKDGTTFNDTGPLVERITVEGGKVEIRGDTIKIEGGKVEIIRRPRP